MPIPPTGYYAGQQVLSLELIPVASWKRSVFPHPLLTVDYDQRDRLIGITVVGPAAQVFFEQGAVAGLQYLAEEKPVKPELVDKAELQRLQVWAQTEGKSLVDKATLKLYN